MPAPHPSHKPLIFLFYRLTDSLHKCRPLRIDAISQIIALVVLVVFMAIDLILN
jgi:hypothetical protein